jgi:hypothetical protein
MFQKRIHYGKIEHSRKSEKVGGSKLQMNTTIVDKMTSAPVVLLESRWLKDARHHNDEGASIWQLREVKKHHPTSEGLPRFGRAIGQKALASC